MKPLNVILFFVVLLLSCNRPTIRMNDYAVHGIDVSHHQSFINWDKIAEQNIHFSFAKATEGMDFVDTLFCHNWEEMNRVGLLRGAYHFFRPQSEAKLQAANFLNWVDIGFGDLPPVLDVEVTDGVVGAELIKSIETWLHLVEQKTLMKPIIYTNQNFFNEHLAAHFQEYPIWIARYNPFFDPCMNNDRNWQFWQYGNRGRLEGIRGDVDFNVFQGSLSDLEELCYGANMAYN